MSTCMYPPVGKIEQLTTEEKKPDIDFSRLRETIDHLVSPVEKISREAFKQLYPDINYPENFVDALRFNAACNPNPDLAEFKKMFDLDNKCTCSCHKPDMASNGECCDCHMDYDRKAYCGFDKGEKCETAQKPWCAYCNAFVEGNGWHLKGDCPDGKYGAVKMAERLEQIEKRGGYNKDYALDLHKTLITVMEDLEQLKRNFNACVIEIQNDTEKTTDRLGERLEKIENLTDFKKLEGCVLDGAQTHLTILKLKKEFEHWHHFVMGLENNVAAIVPMCERIDKLENQVREINGQKFSEFHHLTPRVEKLEKWVNSHEAYPAPGAGQIKQHACPNCKGQGKIMYFVETAKDNTLFLNCVLCLGQGIVWG